MEKAKKKQDKDAPPVLLALANITPDTPWKDAKLMQLGISEIISFLATHYEIYYATGTREMIRKGPIKELMEKGIIEVNADKPDRPANSPKTVYSIKQEYFNKLLLLKD